MEIRENAPIILYDNRCYLCIKFAKLVSFLARNRIMMIGHYSKMGEEVREQILDRDALEMFWFIDERMAYGGRAALRPLVRSMLSSKGRRGMDDTRIDDACNQDCKTVKAVFVRSTSLLTNSKEISYAL